jgi:pimeloyl-ACP methyl ester carboxylesterase
MDRILEIENKKICYSDVGEGSVIVFLHGWMDSKIVFEGLIKILSLKYRCINIDLPGFGKSDIVEDITLSKVSKIIKKLLNKIGVKKYNLIGHSLGGAVVLTFANKYQNNIERIALISPFVTFKQFSKSVFYIIINFIPYIIDKILSFKRPNMKVVNAFRIAYLLSNVDLYKVLRKVRKDILFIYGRNDALLSIKPLEPIFGILNNIHLAIFEDVRHYIFTYNPEGLAEKIDLFFSSNNVKLKAI